MDQKTPRLFVSGCNADWRGEAKPVLLLLSTRSSPHPATRRSYFAADPRTASNTKGVLPGGTDTIMTPRLLHSPISGTLAANKTAEWEKNGYRGRGTAGLVRPSSVPTHNHNTIWSYATALPTLRCQKTVSTAMGINSSRSMFFLRLYGMETSLQETTETPTTCAHLG